MSLARSAIRSVAGYGIINVFVYTLSFIVQIVLANLLTPDIFGAVALAVAITTFATLVLRWGIPQAIMQEDEELEDRFSTVFWINVGGTSALTLLVLVALPLLFTFFQQRVVQVLLLVFSATALRNLALPFRAAIQREFDLPRLAIIQLISLIISAVIGIGLALNGVGVWSLAIYYALRDVLSGIGHLVYSPRYPDFTFDWGTAIWFYSFATGMIGSRVLISVESEGDDFIVGSVLGTASLGLYSFGWRLATAFHSVVHPAINKGIIPTFAKLKESPNESRQAIEFLVRMELGVAIPGYVFAALTAPTVILAIFGPQWSGMIPVFQTLCLSGILFPTLAVARQIYYTWGKPRRVLRIQIVYITALLIAFAVLLPIYDVIGAAIAVNISLSIGCLLLFNELRKDVGISLAKIFGLRLGAGAICLSIGYLTRDPVREVINLDSLMVVSMGVIVALSFYIPLVIFDRKGMKEDFSKISRAFLES